MSHATDVNDLAYRLWDEAGRPEGRDMDFWLQAEAQLKTATKPKAAKAADKPKTAAKPKKAAAKGK